MKADNPAFAETTLEKAKNQASNITEEVDLLISYAEKEEIG